MGHSFIKLNAFSLKSCGWFFLFHCPTKTWLLHSLLPNCNRSLRAEVISESISNSNPDRSEVGQTILIQPQSLGHLSGVNASSMHAHPSCRLPRDLGQFYLQGGSSVVSTSEAKWMGEAVISNSMPLDFRSASLCVPWTSAYLCFVVSFALLRRKLPLHNQSPPWRLVIGVTVFTESMDSDSLKANFLKR